MQFGGMQKNSLIDFPGKISCVLFTSGCNFDCPYCHNPELVNRCNNSPTGLPVKGVYNFLEKRKGFLDGVVISGGEPTLQKNLIETCERIKELGYSIKLDTNGSRPEQLARLIKKKLIDYVAMDIKTDPLYYDPIIRKDCNPEELISSIQIIMDSQLDYEFRTTCIKPLVDEKIVEDIARIIKGASLYVLQLFNNKEVLHPDFFKGNDNTFNKIEIENLRTIAEPWVQKCIVR